MSGGENKKFIAQKVDYLKSRFIIIDPGNFTNGSPKGVYDFDLKVNKSANLQDAAGKKIKVVTLTAMAKRGTASGSRTNNIRAYYLPYARDRGFSHRLLDDVDFCFTDTMNGCTFSVGSGAEPLVSHYNFVNPATQMIDQAKIDRHIDRRYKHGVTKLSRADYKKGGGMDQNVTMIGFREKHGWAFYYQRRSKDLVNIPGKGSQIIQVSLDQSFKFT